MSTLHDTIINRPSFLVPSEVQGDVSCSNDASIPCTSLGSNKPFVELAKTFKSIHVRLLAMGYTIENGVVIENNNQTNEK